MPDATGRLRKIEVLLIVIVVVMVTGVIFQYTAIDRRNRQKQMMCSGFLRHITMAMYFYAQDGDTFPMSTEASAVGGMNLFGYRNYQPASDGIPSPTADLWMLVRGHHADLRDFVCPQSTDTVDPFQDVTTAFDFRASIHLSYGYVYQYHPSRKPLGTGSEPLLPVAADANPYLKGGVNASPQADRASAGRGNSLNHSPRVGQTVAYVDGHVSFIQAPLVNPDSHTSSLRPTTGDNIYTTHADNEPSDPGNAPTWTRIQIGSKSDYCLVP